MMNHYEAIPNVSSAQPSFSLSLSLSQTVCVCVCVCVWISTLILNLGGITAGMPAMFFLLMKEWRKTNRGAKLKEKKGREKKTLKEKRKSTEHARALIRPLVQYVCLCMFYMMSVSQASFLRANEGWRSGLDWHNICSNVVLRRFSFSPRLPKINFKLHKSVFGESWKRRSVTLSDYSPIHLIRQSVFFQFDI